MNFKINKFLCIFTVILLSQIKTYSQVFGSSDLYFEEAKKDLSEENYTKAAKMSWRGLQLSPQDTDLKTILGKSNLELGRYDTARYVLKQVYERNRKNITILQYLVTIEEDTKRYSDAICFVNELLEITPYSKGWWLRKIEIYKKMGNFEEAERALKRIYQIYPEDTEIKNAYTYIMIGDGDKAVREKKYDDANDIYKVIIDSNPENKDAYLGIIRNELLKGNPESALQFTDRALLEMQYDRQLIEKKIGLLEQLGRHAQAIAFINDPLKVPREKFPDIHSITLPYLMQQTAGFNEYNDPYETNKRLVELNGNSESQDYVIKNALGKGYDIDAEYFLSKAIKKNPNNKKLLTQEMELYKPIKTDENYESRVLVMHEKFPDDADITYAYNKIMYDRAKQYVENKEYDVALPMFVDLVSVPDFQKESEQQIFGILLALERYDEATDQIDKLIGLDSENEDYLLKKSTLYQKMELFEDALDITRSLEQKYPLNLKYPTVYVQQIEAFASFLMKEERYGQVLPVIDDGLTRENNNQRLLDMAINASSAIKDYEKAVNYAKSAISFYPNNKNFKLKLSNALGQNKQFDESLDVLESLETTYKYDNKIKNSLAELLWFRARNQEEEGLVDEALKNYNASDSLNPSENYALQRMINLYIDKKSNEEALDVINKKIERYPNDTFLKYKKGLVFELMKQYDSAYYYQSFRKIEDPFERNEWNSTLYMLKAASLKNKLAGTYANVTSDSLAFGTSIASLAYTHKYDKKNIFGADLYYAARTAGAGVQGGVNYSRIFSSSLYANVSALFGSQFFPKFTLSGNAYKELNNGFEAQAGLRFSYLQNNATFYTLGLGGSKNWEDIWLNAKLQLMTSPAHSIPGTNAITGVPEQIPFNTENYFNFTTQTRINISPKANFISFIVSFGNAPYLEQLPEGEAAFLDFNNVLVGAGYGHNISANTMLVLNGSWTNFRSPIIDTDYLVFVNQFNISIITKF
jgi:tetratricopeptide (TPR) repeat protein